MAEPRDSGMTLLEVLVALAILSLGLAALFESMRVGTSTASLADQQRAAVAAGQSLLAELGRSSPIADGTRSGAFATGQSWRLDIAPMVAAPATAAPAVLQGHTARLRVNWPDGDAERSVVFDTLLLTAAP